MTDRLRLKDVTQRCRSWRCHDLALLARSRQAVGGGRIARPLRVVGERARLDVLRLSTERCNVEQRFVARLPSAGNTGLGRRTCPAQRSGSKPQLAAAAGRPPVDPQDPHRSGPPAADDRSRSVVDPDARRGKHGSWYDGYLLDVAIDSDSERITALNELPAKGDEASDAAELVRKMKPRTATTSSRCRWMDWAFKVPCCGNWNPRGARLGGVCASTAETSSEYFKPQEFVKILS